MEGKGECSEFAKSKDIEKENVDADEELMYSEHAEEMIKHVCSDIKSYKDEVHDLLQKIKQLVAEITHCETNLKLLNIEAAEKVHFAEFEDTVRKV